MRPRCTNRQWAFMLPSDRTLRDRYLRAKRRIGQIDQRVCPVERTQNEISNRTICEPLPYTEATGRLCTNDMQLQNAVAQRSTMAVPTIASGVLVSSSELEAEQALSCRDADRIGTTDVMEDLRQWVRSTRPSISSVNKLLAALRRSMPWIPKDYRTLMRTPRNAQTISIGAGAYGHIGLLRGLRSIYQDGDIQPPERVVVQLHIDAFTPFNSSKMQIWPIQCRSIYPVKSKPFVVGVYGGPEKPDVIEFLTPLIRDLQVLLSTGFTLAACSRPTSVELGAVICDAPARAYVKRTKGHSGYSSCGKCIQKGTYVNRKVTFPSTTCRLRSH
ncbi:unnamed protein product, partial [Dicrocoelium dendriticum]